MLSDEALVALDRSELVEMAQHVYDQELRNRRLAPGQGGAEATSAVRDDVSGPKPRWLEDAACAAAFPSYPGSNSVPDAENARDVLEAGGIPCYISVEKVNEPPVDPQSKYEFRVLVPGKFNLEV